MFVMYEKENMKVPVRVWLKERKDLEGSCLEQAYHLSQLPFLHKWVSLMPDTHAGKGMPIGGVIAADGVVIPNAVGVDIGCGMAYTETNIRVADNQRGYHGQRFPHPGYRRRYHAQRARGICTP